MPHVASGDVTSDPSWRLAAHTEQDVNDHHNIGNSTLHILLRPGLIQSEGCTGGLESEVNATVSYPASQPHCTAVTSTDQRAPSSGCRHTALPAIQCESSTCTCGEGDRKVPSSTAQRLQPTCPSCLESGTLILTSLGHWKCTRSSTTGVDLCRPHSRDRDSCLPYLPGSVG